MSTTKNYGLAGVASDVQFGKGGGRLVFNTGASDWRFTSDGTTLVHVQVLDPVDATDAATKSYVDSVASGLDPKASVRVATTVAVTTYNASGGPAGTGQFTSAPSSVDGVTLVNGDRILVKNQGDAKQNGIYVATATTTTWNRASDMDGTPATEVSGGNYVFVEEGSQANSGWVLQGVGTLTLNTDNLNWVLFSSSSDILAGVGLVKNGNALDLDFSELTSQSTIAGTNELIAQFSGTESRITVTNFLNSLNIPNAITANGLVTRTADDTYTSRSLAADTAAAKVGIAVSNADGSGGNPTIGLEINGTTALTDAVATGDSLLIYNAANNGQAVGNYKVTVDQLKTFMNAGTSSSSITAGDSTVSIADTGAGVVTINVDAEDIVSVTASGMTVTSPNTLTLAGMTAGRIVYTSTGGLLVSDANNVYDGSVWTLTGAGNITGDLDVDNINLNGNTISITNTNGNLILTQNGTGQINLTDSGGLEMFEFKRVASAVNHLSFTNAVTGSAPTFSANVTGADTNVDIGFLTKGTGVLTVTGTTNYEQNVTDDDDIPNKKYVDDAIVTGQSGTLDSISGSVNFTSATTQSIGTIPANATILSVTLRVGTASNTATTVTIGDATNGAAAYMAATENDPQQASTTFVADTYVLNGGTSVTANATVATAGASGSGTVVITFRYA
jgi:hypothetical protein